MDKDKEYIGCSAIWFSNDTTERAHFHSSYGIDSGIVLCGFRHPHILAQKKYLPEGYKIKAQGFMTSYGRFVDRHEAAKIAYEAGQIEKPLEVLFSEDVFPKQSYYATV